MFNETSCLVWGVFNTVVTRNILKLTIGEKYYTRTIPEAIHALSMNPSIMIYSGIILAGILMVTGCLDNNPVTDTGGSPVIVLTPVNDTPLVFNELNNGKTYSIPSGTEVWINLSETFATNEPWRVSISSGLDQVSSEYYRNPTSPRFDINGTHRWILRASGTGKQTFHGETGWYNKTDPRSRYDLTFQVNSKSGSGKD
jgi:predicted secreted protein